MVFGAVDIGGTKIKYGVVDDLGTLLFKGSMDTHPRRGSTDLLERIGEKLRKLKERYPLEGIAISTAGQVDFHKGTISYATDLIPGWIGTNIKSYYESTFGLPVVVENDVNCVAMAELWKGAATGRDSFICIALGTGIGGGIFFNGELFRGENFAAGEFGHLKIVDGGRECRCGDRGCYEAHASTDALVSMLQELTGVEKLDGKMIFDMEKKGISPYKEEVTGWIGYITDGLKNIAVSFNPSLIVIGGGVSAQGDYLLERIKTDLSRKIMPSFYEKLDLRMASSGNDAGMLGATYLLIKEISS